MGKNKLLWYTISRKVTIIINVVTRQEGVVKVKTENERQTSVTVFL